MISILCVDFIVANILFPSTDQVHQFNFLHDSLSSFVASRSSAWPNAGAIASVPVGVELCRATQDGLFAFDDTFCEISGDDGSSPNVTVLEFTVTKQIDSLLYFLGGSDGRPMSTMDFFDSNQPSVAWPQEFCSVQNASLVNGFVITNGLFLRLGLCNSTLWVNQTGSYTTTASEIEQDEQIDLWYVARDAAGAPNEADFASQIVIMPSTLTLLVHNFTAPTQGSVANWTLLSTAADRLTFRRTLFEEAARVNEFAASARLDVLVYAASQMIVDDAKRVIDLLYDANSPYYVPWMLNFTEPFRASGDPLREA
jgi:hypothetical protein